MMIFCPRKLCRRWISQLDQPHLFGSSRNICSRARPSFGAVLQTGRLFGAQLGAAFVQTFLRVREQVYSNLIGQHVAVGSWLTSERLQNYAQLVKGRSIGQVDANARATALLADAVRKQAYVLAFIDGFMVLGFAVIGVLLIMLLLRTPLARGGPTPEQSIS